MLAPVITARHLRRLRPCKRVDWRSSMAQLLVAATGQPLHVARVWGVHTGKLRRWRSGGSLVELCTRSHDAALAQARRHRPFLAGGCWWDARHQADAHARPQVAALDDLQQHAQVSTMVLGIS